MAGRGRFAASAAFVLAYAAFCAASAAAEAGGVRFSAVSWDFGSVSRGEVAHLTLIVTNDAASETTVSLIPTCDCLKVEPGRLSLSTGARAEFLLAYDSSDDLGEVRKDFIVSVEPVGPRKALFTVSGTVKDAPLGGSAASGGLEKNVSRPPAGSAAPKAPGKPPRPEASEAAGVETVITYYYTAGCRSCERFLAEEIPRLERDLGIKLVVEKRDVLDAAAYAELERYASSRGWRISALPALRAGDILLQGEEEIRGKLEGTLAGLSGASHRATALARQARGARREGGRETDSESPLRAPPQAGNTASRLAVFPVIAGGLLDGINPCAFTTLIFLLASLALAGKGRREVLIIGVLFSLSVFLTYLSVGLGFFAALRAASAYATVALVLRWLLVAVLVTFAAASLYDFLLIKRGRPTEILLQLPMALKKRIHASIRTRVRTAALAGSSLVLGFLVSIFEFACTGQVYLPTLAYLVRLERQPQALALLVLYNLAFIAPLLGVFAASYLGVGSERVTRLFQRHMAAVKMGLAVFFLGLAIFTLAG